MTMDKQQLIISIIANLNSSSNRPSMLKDEDFVVDPNGEWIKQGEGYVSKTLWRSMRLMTFGTYQFSPYVPVDVRRELILERQAEYNREREKMEQELASLTRFTIVTTPEYRLVRYATERAEEIIRESERIFIQTDPSLIK